MSAIEIPFRNECASYPLVGIAPGSPGLKSSLIMSSGIS